MKLKINKKQLKNLSEDKRSLPREMTPQVVGGCVHCRKHSMWAC
ncbi:hypothetical protein [Pseudoalteromonas denitrificans]|uniref:Uncharacterized protein n=1 Tax=Pseudoalteromonas denitrificans DSM 6059 TaxID=1123010 RepID=A0A1I1RQE0_9GAMM|nr:hypothetical protein [Pseudoalteromonas denitrificans]SFD34478.1 hypothetical protein SAMN02745724_04259 [Pseudoalteromonas denitrificans DSM 6059]